MALKSSVTPESFVLLPSLGALLSLVVFSYKLKPISTNKGRYAGHFRKCLTLGSRFFQIFLSDTLQFSRFSDAVRGL